jgi:hypothetical protein
MQFNYKQRIWPDKSLYRKLKRPTNGKSADIDSIQEKCKLELQWGII